MYGSVTQESLLGEWRELQRIRRLPEGGCLGFIHDMFGKPRHEQHSEQYDKFRFLVLLNQDALFSLIFSGQITDEKELHELIFFGGHGGSVAKKDNMHWAPFVARVRQRQQDLPESI